MIKKCAHCGQYFVVELDEVVCERCEDEETTANKALRISTKDATH